RMARAHSTFGPTRVCPRRIIMTTSTGRHVVGWLAWLGIGCLVGAAILAGRTLEQKGPTVAAAQRPVAQVLPEPEKGSGLRRLDAEQLAELEQKLQKLYAKLAPSVVRILEPNWVDERYPDSKGTLGASGVIISSAGEILTCGHHSTAPRA